MKELIFLLFIFIVTSSSGQSVNVYFGSMDTKAGGIYHAKFETEHGQLKAIHPAASDPSNFMALHPNRDLLYSVARLDGEAAIIAYQIVDDGQLKRLNKVISPEGIAAHLAVHPSGDFLITAHYGEGSTVVFPIAEDGRVEKPVAVLKHQNTDGGKKLNRKGPHPHWTGFSPDGRFAFVPDLGLDEIFGYKVLEEPPFLQLHQRFAAPEGAGPRHMRFSIDGRFVYVLNEITLSVTTYNYDPESGTLKMSGTTKTLVDDEVAKNEDNRASEILVHPNGKYVFTANRGHDSVTTFEVDEETGGLKLIQLEPIRGAWPRNINLDRSGKWLLAAGMHSNTVAVFSIDQGNGKLQFPMGRVYSIPAVRCVLFGE